MRYTRNISSRIKINKPNSLFPQKAAFSTRIENLSLSDDLTVADLINFESEVLGNREVQRMALEAEKRLKINLTTIPISKAVWVTRTYEQATRYAFDSEGNQIAEISRIEILPETYVLADIGEDGVLLLLPDESKK